MLQLNKYSAWNQRLTAINIGPFCKLLLSPSECCVMIKFPVTKKGPE